jgi:hypothetical protein
MSVNNMSVGQISVNIGLVSLLFVSQMPVGQMSTSQMPVRKMPISKMISPIDVKHRVDANGATVFAPDYRATVFVPEMCEDSSKIRFLWHEHSLVTANHRHIHK